MITIHELLEIHNKEYITVNKKIIQEYGTDAAVLLGELISKQKYWDDNGKLFRGRFWWSVRDIILTTGLRQRDIKRAVDILKQAGFIDVEAVPQRITLYKVNTGAVSEFLDSAVVKRGKQFFHDTVPPVIQDLTVPTLIQNCNNGDTETVPMVIHTNPVNPVKPSISQKSKKPRKEENNVIKGTVSLYYQLLEEVTKVKPLQNWKRDYSILQKAADGKLQEQDPDVIEAKLRAWFKDNYAASAGYPLGLFVSNYNSIQLKRDDKLRDYTGATDMDYYPDYYVNQRGEKIYEVVL